MERVIGIGGVFMKSPDPQALARWYQQHLGFPVEDWGGACFYWGADPPPQAHTVWGLFPEDSSYFDPSPRPFMLNLLVRDLDAMLAQLRAGGVSTEEPVVENEHGRFAYVTDPDGNRVELLQPASLC